jgi:hypothetical protein
MFETFLRRRTRRNCKRIGLAMDFSEFVPRELQRCVGSALDLVTAHRIAKGLVLDQEIVTAMHESLEEPLVAAFSEFDIGLSLFAQRRCMDTADKTKHRTSISRARSLDCAMLEP